MRVVSLNISPGGIPKIPVERAIVLNDRIEGDGRNHAKHDQPWRAVSLLDTDQIARFRAKGFDIYPGMMGENLTVEGLDCRTLDPGDRLTFDGGVVLEITEPRIPCYVLDPIADSLKDDAWGCCGAMAKVIRTGVLTSGESLYISGNSLRDGDGFRWHHTAVILAGGRSRRMGEPKEGVRLPDGRTMLEHIVDNLSRVAVRTVVAGECAGFEQLEALGLQKIPDRFPGCGPLAGIDAVLSSGLDDRYLIIACDQPLVSSYLLRVLCSRDTGVGLFFRTERGEKHDPFPGIYPASWASEIEDAVRGDDRGVVRYIRSRDVEWVTIPARMDSPLRSINTREELLAIQDFPSQSAVRNSSP